jgi:hypothetical protein
MHRGRHRDVISVVVAALGFLHGANVSGSHSDVGACARAGVGGAIRLAHRTLWLASGHQRRPVRRPGFGRWRRLQRQRHTREDRVGVHVPFRGRTKPLGLSVDYITLSLADTETLAPDPPFDISVDIDGELDLDVAEVAAFYRPSGEVDGVNFLFGLRQISAEQTLFVTASIGEPQRIDTDADVTDIFLGARYLHRFSDRWGASIRGDVSFGDSEGTLNMLTGVGYRVAGPFALQLGYRYATISIEEVVDSTTLTTDITLDGPYLGFVFRF